MEVEKRTAFLERLSLLSFAAVAGCAGGGSALVPVKGTDGAAQPAIGDKHVDATTGATTYTLGSGYTLTTTPGVGTFSAVLALKGSTVNTMTGTYSSDSQILTFTESKGGAVLSVNTNDPAPTTLYDATLSYTSNGGSLVGPSGQKGSVATTITQGTTTNTVTANGTYQGYSYAGALTLNKTTSTGGGCHACPLVGIEAVHTELLVIPKWVGDLFVMVSTAYAMFCFLSAVYAAEGILVATVGLVLAAVGAIIALF
jgi:hypothetical protein